MNESLLRRLDRLGLAQAVTAAHILDAADRVSGGHFHAKIFRNGVLTVNVESSLEAFYTRNHEEQTIENINAALGEAKVKSIKIKL